MWLSLILSYDSIIEPRCVSENIPQINSAVKHLIDELCFFCIFRTWTVKGHPRKEPDTAAARHESGTEEPYYFQWCLKKCEVLESCAGHPLFSNIDIVETQTTLWEWTNVIM